MTIARRILLLVGLAPLILAALGLLTHVELATIESRSRFVAETQVPSLSSLGNISRAFEEMRVALRDHLLAPDAAGRTKARQAFDARRAELDQLLRKLRRHARFGRPGPKVARRVSGPGHRMGRGGDGCHGPVGRRPPRGERGSAGRPPHDRPRRAFQRCPPRVDRVQPGPGRDAPAPVRSPASRTRGVIPTSRWPSRCSCRAVSAC